VATRFRFVLGVTILAWTGALAAGCSGHDQGPQGTRSDGLTVCWGDSGLCVNTPDFDGGGGFFPGFDATTPTWPDAGFGGFGGFNGFDAGNPFCNWTDPKYAQEYQTAAFSAALKPCAFGCAATECCYAGLSCVAQ
jgi:hypothetical protein